MFLKLILLCLNLNKNVYVAAEIRHWFWACAAQISLEECDAVVLESSWQLVWPAAGNIMAVFEYARYFSMSTFSTDHSQSVSYVTCITYISCNISNITYSKFHLSTRAYRRLVFIVKILSMRAWGRLADIAPLIQLFFCST